MQKMVTHITSVKQQDNRMFFYTFTLTLSKIGLKCKRMLKHTTWVLHAPAKTSFIKCTEMFAKCCNSWH